MLKIRFASYLLAAILLAVVAGGCGERTESTSYSHSPSWISSGANSGKIIYIKTLEQVRKDWIGTQLGSTYTDTISAVWPSGTGEAALFDVTGDTPYQMSCSPTSEFVGYMTDLRQGSYGKIVIRYIGSGMSPTFEKNIIPRVGLKSFDWANDGKSIVYCTTTEVRTMNLQGNNDTLVTAESDLSFVSWKYGGRIAFVHGPATQEILSLIYSDGSGRLDLTTSASVDLPQISSANTNEVYGIAGGSYCKVDVSAGTPATTEIAANFTGTLPRLSPAADKVVYSKSGESSGIYLLDVVGIDMGKETPVK